MRSDSVGEVFCTDGCHAVSRSSSHRMLVAMLRQLNAALPHGIVLPRVEFAGSVANSIGS
ncbi:MAG: hypothetical protein HQ518_05270 [Rhodopirellula sp.]|nr:hypothetical protein [Rhodopirellula sp.]